MSDKPKRRWFHFSIRDLVLVTVIAAVFAARWADRKRARKEADKMRTEIKLLESQIVRLSPRGFPGPPPVRLPIYQAPAPNPPKP